jgi:hypothetical protein
MSLLPSTSEVSGKGLRLAGLGPLLDPGVTDASGLGHVGPGAEGLLLVLGQLRKRVSVGSAGLAAARTIVPCSGPFAQAAPTPSLTRAGPAARAGASPGGCGSGGRGFPSRCR